MIIDTRNLKKTYITYERGTTFGATIKSLFVRKPIEIEALKGIYLSIEKGEIIGLIGPNGAGKSTTLKILSGILHPTSGEADVMGFTPWKQRKKYVANIGAVFGQKSQLIWDIPPMDSFQMNKAIYNIPEEAFTTRLNALVEMLDLSRLIHKPTRQLSLGERMKCEFVMAMLHDPPIVFLDEPTIGLDVIAKEVIRKFIKEMNAKGTTFILTTHDLDDIELLANRVVVINHGSIVFDDSLTNLMGKLGHKKIVKVILSQAYAGTTLKSGLEYEKNSELELEFTLDTSQMSLKAFMDHIAGELEIKDISIESEDIETVIKELYLI
ncbi:MAG: ATP-binding cassette domain-containing protein [Vallitaleaceae bacterium]|jgi:ABC-2 type transport system ATP-binding protein|nr:ATP-binding cassette domain-containing protein [Vallitaleaceae bacterium]